MACDLTNLSVLAYANGFTLWHYTTGDAEATVVADDYFADARDLLKPGDMVLTNLTAGDTPEGRILQVTSVDAAAVSVGSVIPEPTS